MYNKDKFYLKKMIKEYNFIGLLDIGTSKNKE